MPRIRRSWIVLITAVGLIAAAGVASADDTLLNTGDDTLLNIGYDEENHVLIVSRSATDSPFDCRLENGALTVEYGTPEEGPIPADTLEIAMDDGEFEAFLFLNRPEAETEAGAGGECGLSGAVVGGPNGQINHGQFMKLFHQLVDGQGFGCLNRMMAQSDLGKGEQQVRTSDVDSEEMGENGTVTFQTFYADCDHDKKEKGDGHPGRGTEKAAKSDSPGKSGEAKGRNK